MGKVLSASLPRTIQGTRSIYQPFDSKGPRSQHREPKVKGLRTAHGRSPKEICYGRYPGSWAHGLLKVVRPEVLDRVEVGGNSQQEVEEKLPDWWVREQRVGVEEGVIGDVTATKVEEPWNKELMGLFEAILHGDRHFWQLCSTVCFGHMMLVAFASGCFSIFLEIFEMLKRAMDFSPHKM